MKEKTKGIIIMLCLGMLFSVFGYVTADVSSYDNIDLNIYDKSGSNIIGSYNTGMNPTISYIGITTLLIFLLIGIMVLFDEELIEGKTEVKKDVQSTSKKTARKVR